MKVSFDFTIHALLYAAHFVRDLHENKTTAKTTRENT